MHHTKSYAFALYFIVGFFISVSSLKVFGHSIHSERRMIYPGKSIQALQNDTFYHIMVIQFQNYPANGAVAHFENFYVCLHLFLFTTSFFKVIDY